MMTCVSSVQISYNKKSGRDTNVVALLIWTPGVWVPLTSYSYFNAHSDNQKPTRCVKSCSVKLFYLFCYVFYGWKFCWWFLTSLKKSCSFTTLDSYKHTHLDTIIRWFARQQSTLRLFTQILLIQPKQPMHWYWEPLKRFKANKTKQFNARWTCQ